MYYENLSFNTKKEKKKEKKENNNNKVTTIINIIIKKTNTKLRVSTWSEAWAWEPSQPPQGGSLSLYP